MRHNSSEHLIENMKRDVFGKIWEKRPPDCTLREDELRSGFQRAFDTIIFHNPTVEEIEEVAESIRSEGVSEDIVEEHEQILFRIKIGSSVTDRQIVMVKTHIQM